MTDLSLDLEKRIEAVKRRRGPGYRARTRHVDENGEARYTNRLFLESSPYLLQHAHNPVAWYPWGDEAFEAARKLNRPVLLSVGYSTCHWCHVMEEESFEDEEVARFINDNYIAVKVDREERPDVDAVYMAAVQALTGGGGWPMTVWLTPERKPFYGGTYFPARDGDRGAAVGFLTLLQRLKESYDTRQDIIGKTSRSLVDAVRNILSPGIPSRLPDEGVLRRAYAAYAAHADPVNGGLGGAPKFPSSLPIRFLLRYHHKYADRRALAMATLTLDKMAAGGMYDHVGGGFHRYATDAEWRVPHFEKMLYDNALLVMDYLEGYQVTGNAEYARVVRETLEYVRRDMTAPHGAFFSATDADSPTPEGGRQEGYFFTWTLPELEKALGSDLFSPVKAYYANRLFPDFEGRHILHAPIADTEVAARLGMKIDRFRQTVRLAKSVLLKERSRRPPPLRDEKILAAWNGLMISAFARAGLMLGTPGYLRQAEAAAEFVRRHLVVDKRLHRSYKDGSTGGNGFLEDYAFVIAAFIDLFEATHDLGWLEAAIELDRTLADRFEDRDSGGYFAVSDDHEALIAREKPNYDGALPSGNSVAVMNLLRLGALTSDPAYRARAERALSALAAVLETHPTAMAELLCAVHFHLGGAREIVIVTPDGEKDAAEPFLERLRKIYAPHRTLVVVSQGDELSRCAGLIPAVRGRTAADHGATAYICRDGACGLPAADPEEFARQLATLGP